MKIKKQYRVMDLENKLLFLIIVFLLIYNVKSIQPFCYITCQPGNCGSSLATTCQSCSTYFTLSATAPASCNFDIAQTTVKLSKTSSDFNVSPNPTSNCSANYHYFGEYGNNTATLITTLTPITDNHYQIDLIIWMLLIDTWPSNSYVNVKLVSTGQNIMVSQTNTSTNADYCYGGANDGYARFFGSYAHNNILNTLQFNVTTYITHNSGKLAIGDIFIIAHLCHSYCKVCTGAAPNVCSSCSVGYYLSGTQCAANCLSTYGLNLPSNVCISCHSYCLACDTSPTNCTTCKDTIIVGTNVTPSQIYKVQNANACEVICPAGYYEYLASKKCLSCAVHCATITITSQLILGNASLQFLYTFSQAMNFGGFNYANFLGFNCSNTSINTVSDFNIVYQMIDNTHFKLALTPKPTKYLVSSDVCTIIKPQTTNSYQYSLNLNKLSPTVYTSYNCIQWSTPQVNMTISNLLDTTLKFIQFTFTFTSPMQFTGFVYTNFILLSQNNSIINIATDFVVTYTMIDTKNFKIKLKPNQSLIFLTTAFCATSKAQGLTSLQFSYDNYKLNPSVYGKQNCINWQILPTELSMSSQLISDGAYAEYLFTFSMQMNFASFDYTNFAFFTTNNTGINFVNDFDVVYNQIDSFSFKLNLFPKPPTYFVDSTFCAVTKSQSSTTLQSSKYLYKLSSSVYSQQSCLNWIIIPVQMVLTGQIILNGKNTEFTFTFTKQMNFNNFDYTNFVDFSLNISSLNIVKDFIIGYIQMNSFAFKLTITPKSQLNFTDLEICLKSKSKSNTLLQYSLNSIPLKSTVYGQSTCLVWTPQFPIKQEYYKDLQQVNNQIQGITTQKGIQQIIKSGVFAFIFPGAQLSSTVLLHNPRINQNLYQGTRFWGSFVFFDVPPYQQNSNRTKYLFVSPDKQLIQNNTNQRRRLQQSKVSNFITEWKFDRTGHTGFFIFDTYIQLILIGSAWILLLIGWLYARKCQQSATTDKINTRIMAIFHKIHQMSLFYLLLAALIQFKNFDNTNYLHTISIIISSTVLFYYLIYELKIFYDMINYPQAKIGTNSYIQFIKNYSFFIAYCRFQEYNDKNKWNWRHFLRPYNYHTLTFIKKALMVSAIPIFYDHGLSPVIILTILQTIDVLRFVFTIPYQKLWRNFLYFGLEVLLLVFFTSSLINQMAGLQLLDDTGLIINFSYLSMYKNSGMIGMIIIFIYNILYSLISLVELGIILCTKSSLQNMVWSNRNQYYQQLYGHFQQYGSYYRLIKNYTDQLVYNRDIRQAKTFKAWINKIHDAQPIVDLSAQKLKVFKQISERGNIYLTDFEQEQIRQTVQIRIQVFKIRDFQSILCLSNFNKGQLTPKNQDSMIKKQTQSYSGSKRPSKSNNDIETKSMKDFSHKQNQQNNLSYQIDYQIIPVLFKPDQNTNQNIINKVYIPKKIKNLIHSDALNPHFQKNLAMTLLSYQMPGTQEIKLSTYLKIDLRNYKKGQKIAYIRQNMRQQIVVKRYQIKNKIQLKEVMYGFPVNWQALQKVKQSQSGSPLKKQKGIMGQHFFNILV